MNPGSVSHALADFLRVGSVDGALVFVYGDGPGLDAVVALSCGEVSICVLSPQGLEFLDALDLVSRPDVGTVEVRVAAVCQWVPRVQRASLFDALAKVPQAAAESFSSVPVVRH